ncbi:MAG: chromosome segregation protein, partial [Sphingomonas sp.]
HRLETLRTERAALDRRIAELADARARIVTDREREGALANDAADALARLAAETRALETDIASASERLPQLDAALAAAERHARDAEVALAQALAAQASEAADARVAQAALQAARARLDRAARDRGQLEAERAALGDAAPLKADREAAAAARVTAIDAAETARAARARADSDEHSHIEARDRAQARRASARADLAALDSEAAALEQAVKPSGRDRLLDRVSADPGFERALAAALGDDLEAGLDTAADRFWQGAAPQSGDPAPPVGTVALGKHVAAPDGLARRLAQVFVADADEKQALAVGQRLVTLGGVLRRWDGFVARSGGAAAAERLERVNRLAALRKARPAAAEKVAGAEAELARLEQAIADARSQAQAARGALERAEAAQRDAARAEDRAAAALERIEAKAADLDVRSRRVAADHEEADAERRRAEAAIAALPDGAATATRVQHLQSEAEARRTTTAQARADRAGLDRDIAGRRERLAAAQAESRSWRARAGEAARRIADMEKRDADLTREADQLAARPQALDEEIASVDRDHSAARGAAEATMGEETAADAALRSADDVVRIAGEALAEVREARAGAAARAENQEQRRVEMGRLSGERFECPPPVLPERLGFASADVGTPAVEASTHEKLTIDRERIGPVNLVAEAELAELDATRLANAAEREELGLAVNRLRGSICNLNREGRQRLLAAFEAVNGHFQ